MKKQDQKLVVLLFCHDCVAMMSVLTYAYCYPSFKSRTKTGLYTIAFRGGPTHSYEPQVLYG